MKNFILITGSSSGIGREIAIQAAQAGFNVIAACRNPDEVIFPRENARIIPLELDVTQDDCTSTLASKVASLLKADGLLVAVINNAGICHSAPVECMNLDAFREHFDVNVVGVLAVAQAMLPFLRQSKGKILNIGSGVAYVAPPYMAAYAASKVALDALTTVMQRELDVPVALIVPGALMTPVWQKIQTSVEACVALMSAEQRTRYEKKLHKFTTLNANTASKSTMSASSLAGDVIKLLNATSLKSVYFFGTDATAGFLLSRIAPRGLMSFAFKQML